MVEDVEQSISVSELEDETEKKILLALCIDGMRTGYDLHSGKKKIMSNGAWHWAHKNLLKNHLIEIKKKDFDFKTQNRGRKRIFYGPTGLGVIMALHLLRGNEPKDQFGVKVENIASNWGDLIPLVLGKWKTVKQNNLERSALIQLNKSTSIICLYQTKTEFFVHIFSQDFYYGILDYISSSKSFGKEDREKWLAFFSSDPKISEFVKQLFRQHIAYLQCALENKKEIYNILTKTEI